MGGEGIHGNDLPQWSRSDSGQNVCGHKESFQIHPFLGRHSDLDLDFNEKCRPLLITRLLTSCLERADGPKFSEQEIWHWSLKQRFQALLAIAITTLGQHQRLRLRCSNTTCQELMEIDLDLALFVQEEHPDSFLCRLDPEIELALRLPRGVDQLDWLNTQDTEEESWFCEMASTLVCSVNGEKPDQGFRVKKKWLDQIGAALEQHDDLMTLEINSQCPACGEGVVVDIDLEEKLLEFLAKEQQLLLGQIHKLASIYHWSEADIVAMPKQRKKYYLALIDEESAP